MPQRIDPSRLYLDLVAAIEQVDSTSSPCPECGEELKEAVDSASEEWPHSLMHKWCRRADINTILTVQDGNQQTIRGSPVYIATVLDSPASVRILLRAKADPNYRHSSGDTALLHCIETRSLETLRILLSSPTIDVEVATVDRKMVLGQTISITLEGGRPPLFLAIENGEPEFVRILLQHGARTHSSDSFGRSPLQAACECLALQRANSKDSLRLERY